ncbi:OmpA family protein [Castellaniella hirudinis]|uniref:OmpA family protein n=1 Tax=Castellaniella hirudinis TaxID=1144617 RepID=A0ABV8S2H2_9BURK
MKPHRVIVTIHGIRTYGQWQHRLATQLKGKSPAIEIETYGYGYFSVLAFLFPPLRWLATLQFRRELIRILAKYPLAQIDLVAHSFGTHLVGFSIRKLDPIYRKRIHTVLLAGSVLRSDFPWAQLIDSEYVQRVVNDCGVDDKTLILSQFFVLFTGMAGRVGFIGTTNHCLINRYFRGGHSHYFEQHREVQFMEMYWISILSSHNHEILPIDEREALGPTQGLLLAAMQMAEPIKLLFYIGIPSLLVFFFHLQPIADARAKAVYESELREKETKRANAEKAKADALDVARQALAEKAEAEAASYQLIQQIAAQQRKTALKAWNRQARLIAALPADARLAAFSESLPLLDSTIVFDYDHSSLTQNSKEALNQFIAGYNEANIPNGRIILSGHTGKFCHNNKNELLPDSSPISKCANDLSEAYAQKLSERLTGATKAYLVSKGVPPNRIYIKGYGLSEAELPYPTSGYAKSWNLIANQNNQVIIRLMQ